MARQFPETLERNAAVYSPASWWADVRKYPLRYRMIVVAPSAAAAVRELGGWLFDLTTAGWEVTVAAPDHTALPALRVLGARALDLGQALTMPVGDAGPEIVAVSGEYYRADAPMRERILRDCGCHRARTVVWGPDLPAGLDDSAEATRHRISTAGRAFKVSALRTAGLSTESVDLVETVWAERAAPSARRAPSRVDHAVAESNSATVALLP